MVQCEFEEREYETVLYHQLQTLPNHLWAPGQVLEAQVGFDYSALSNDAFFWAWHGYSGIPPGIFLASASHLYSKINRPLPNFALNLFIQAKRPEYLKRVNKSLAQNGLKSPYWRFKTQTTQQARLSLLASTVGHDGLVCYASPAFHQVLQLNHHTVNHSVVANSTFPPASVLNSPHKAWNYHQPGIKGVANTDPVYVAQPSLTEQLDRLALERSQELERPVVDSLERLAQEVRSAAHDVAFGDDAATVQFSVREQQIDAAFLRAVDDESTNALRSFLHVHNFARSYQILWLTLGAEESHESLQI